MVSEDSGDIWHHPVHLDGIAVPARCGQRQGLLGFTGVDVLQLSSAHHSPVVHLLHSRSSDGVLRLPICFVLL